MSSITQTTSLKGSLMWMGTCDEETCEDFDLTPYSQGGANEGVINFIYQVGSGTIGEMWKGDQPSMFNSLNGSDNSNTLFCGKCYYIMLNPATDSNNPFVLDIPGAKFDYSDSPKRGRIFDISSGKAQYLGDISQLPSVIAKGEFQNLITDADTGEEYSTTQTLTTDKDGVYIKPDGSVHKVFNGVPFEIPAGSKLLKGKFGVLDTDGDGTPDTHDSQPNESDRDSGSSGGGSAMLPIDNNEDALLESFKITLPGRNWTDLEFFWDPLTRKYNNKESNYNDWYIALDSSSNTWKTYLIYNNTPTEADEISASINILNTNSQTATISDAVYVESPALPKSFVVTGGNIDNNAEGTYTLVFNSNSDFYYTNNNSSVEYQMKYDYDTKNWKSFSINPINGSSTFYKDVTDPGVKFLTEIVANEVVEMGSDLQRTYRNPAYASKAQTVNETMIFNGRSEMTSDWTANSFVMPDCAKSLSQSYQFIPDSTGDFNLQRKQVAAYYPVPPRNRSEFYKELAPSIHLSTFGIPLGFGTWDSSNFTTDGSTVSDPETEELCPAPYGRNKMRFELEFENPSGSNGELPVLDFVWDHYYKRYTARDRVSHIDRDNNVPFASAGAGIGTVSEYETLIIPSSLNTSGRPFNGWYVATEGSGGTSITWNIPFTDYTNKHKYKVLARTWFPSHDGDLPFEFWGDAGPELVYGTNKVIIQRIDEMSDHPTYSAERYYSDPLYVPEDILNYYWGEGISFTNVPTTNSTNTSLEASMYCGPAKKGGTDPATRNFSSVGRLKVLTDHPYSKKSSNPGCYSTDQSESTEINISNEIESGVFLKNYTTGGWDVDLFSTLSFVQLSGPSSYIAFNVTGEPIVNNEVYGTFPISYTAGNTNPWDYELTITLILRGILPS